MNDSPKSSGSSHADLPPNLEPLPDGNLASVVNGKRIGEYVIIEPLGGGGGGRVFKARHQRMERTVAIKFLNKSLSSNVDMQKRFMREVQTAAKLLHPNIVTAFDAGQHQDNLYLVMEYVEGESLAEHVSNKGPIALRAATTCIIEVARALEYAHASGIIHRDVKPGNIMLASQGQIKVLDMGLARFQQVSLPNEETVTNNDLTGHGFLVGTVGYISPEQVVNSHEVDQRTDIYGLGCTFHFLLTGKPPFSGTVMQTLIAHARDPAPSLHASLDDVPAAVDHIFQKMLAKDRDERYTSMTEVITALQSLIGAGRTAGNATSTSPGRREDVRRADRLFPKRSGLTLAQILRTFRALVTTDSQRASSTIVTAPQLHLWSPLTTRDFILAMTHWLTFRRASPSVLSRKSVWSRCDIASPGENYREKSCRPFWFTSYRLGLKIGKVAQFHRNVST